MSLTVPFPCETVAAPLVLVAADFVAFDPEVIRLNFDRAIDVSGLNPPQITVEYPSGTGWAYAGTSVADQPDAQSVEIVLDKIGSAQGTVDVLSATAATGIVAVDDGGTWAGVTDLPLPFP